MSTDTAFALGVVALVAPGGTRLRVRLLTLAVVDDLVALIVIATAYTEEVDARPARGGGRAVRAAVRAPVRAAEWRGRVAVVLGVAVWVALLESGIDPVIAGLAVGLITSSYPPARVDLERVVERTRSFREQPTPELARSAQLGRRVGDLAQRAPPAPPAPLDELRDRAAVRARQRRHPRRRLAARRRDRVARSRSASSSATCSASRSASSARPGSPTARRAAACGWR